MKKITILLLVLTFLCCGQIEKAPKKTKPLYSTKGKKVTVYTTASETNLRLSITNTTSFERAPQARENEVSIFVKPNKTFQSFIGIGAAITDASAEVFATLSKEKQEYFLKSYFHTQEGIGYSLLRTTIHSADFGRGSYTYVTDEDKELKTFSIEHDKKERIPMIKRATEAAGGEIVLYASPWSPPAWMKSNKNMLQGGRLLNEYYDSWALYYTKFIKEYEKEGMPIWGITIQNEPMATQRWESCIYTAEEERDFLKNHLGPTMERAGLGDKKIVVWDHNRDLLANRSNTILEDPEAAKYVWGVGFHWYEVWTGSLPNYDNLKNMKESYPDKNLLFTEGCVEGFRADRYQYWPNAERYGTSMINDFNNGTSGWTDWNILLNENGGPNHVQNYCFAPVHADTNTGALIYTPSYYYIGHFSKFIRPNAKRVSTSVSRTQLQSTSFINENGEVVTVVMNQTNEKINYRLYVGKDAVTETILPHAIQTFVY